MYDPTPPEENEDELKPRYNPATTDNSPVDEFELDIPEDDIQALYNPETMKFLEEMEAEEENEDSH